MQILKQLKLCRKAGSESDHEDMGWAHDSIVNELPNHIAFIGATIIWFPKFLEFTTIILHVPPKLGLWKLTSSASHSFEFSFSTPVLKTLTSFWAKYWSYVPRAVSLWIGRLHPFYFIQQHHCRQKRIARALEHWGGLPKQQGVVSNKTMTKIFHSSEISIKSVQYNWPFQYGHQGAQNIRI